MTPRPVVAVVEDDTSVRTALGRLLCAAGYETALFESAEAYIDARPASLCVVIDVRLPGMSGLDLQQRLHAAGGGPPIIVMTANHEAVVYERARKNGCVAFFAKPIDGKVLIAAIAALEHRRDETP